MILLALTLLAGQAAEPSAATAAKPAADGDRVICRQLPRTGSRIPPKRMCRTAAEWAESERTSREEFDHAKFTSPGGGRVGLGPN